MTYTVGAHSLIGPRPRNEDRALVMQVRYGAVEGALAVVCDGVGGGPAGDRAAEETTGFAARLFGWLPPQGLPIERGAFRKAVQAGVEQWHTALLQHLAAVQARERLGSYATTLVAALVWGDELAVWWGGDSRAYTFSQGRLQRLTQDHSVVEQQLQLPEEVAQEHPERSHLLRFVRPGVAWSPSFSFAELCEGDVVLLATDGISGSCKSWELEAALCHLLTAQTTPDAICRNLLEYLAPNLTDNATVAAIMRGAARPFNGCAVLEQPTYARRGLSAEAMAGLTAFPASTAEWLNRAAVPVIKARPPRVVGPAGRMLDRGAAAVCLRCGFLVRGDQRCPEHGAESLWRGCYVHVVGPHGAQRWCPVIEGVTVVGSAGDGGADIRLDDETVSPQHCRIALGPDGAIRVFDQASDNAVWLQTAECARRPAEFGAAEFVLRVGQHQLAFHVTDNLASRSAP